MIATESDFRRWIIEIDPDADILGAGSSGGAPGGDYVTDMDLRFRLNDATEQQVMKHLQDRIREQIKKRNWPATGNGSRGTKENNTTSFHFSCSDEASGHVIFLWLVPRCESQVKSDTFSQTKKMDLRVLQVGHVV